MERESKTPSAVYMETSRRYLSEAAFFVACTHLKGIVSEKIVSEKLILGGVAVLLAFYTGEKGAGENFA